jgi:tetratricopeptide (TPR) repeat protein
MDFAQNKNDFASALANLRASVRLNPNNEVYQNDLGVTEMRVGQLDKAKKRFVEALKINKHYYTAQENIDDLIKFMGMSNHITTTTNTIITNTNTNTIIIIIIITITIIIIR